jgi:hypothetical protein
MRTLVANAAMQPWVDDALRFPRRVPAALRSVLDAGFTVEAGATYLTALRREVSGDLEQRFATVVEREGFINAVQLGSLKPTRRLDDSTPEWAYECVAIGIALGEIVLEHQDVVVTITLDFGDDVDYPSSTFRFTTDDWAGDVDTHAMAVLVMRRD